MKKRKLITLLAFTAAFFLPVSVFSQTAHPAGITAAIKVKLSSLLVVGISDIPGAGGKTSPAKDCGIEKGDIIKSVNGVAAVSAAVFSEEINKSGTNAASICIERGGETLTKQITPKYYAEADEYKTGMWVRDSASGLGTITYVLEDGSFGALGHAITDADTGTVLHISDGECCPCRIFSVMKGKKGVAGELRGALSGGVTAYVESNTSAGIFGKANPSDFSRGAVEIASAKDVTTGDATILADVTGAGAQEYSAVIERVMTDDTEKNMILRITDKRLLDKTGGIVQGMSGSPILQNGTLVGAVTHVFVNDPERGYGIFAENMISAAGGS